MKKLFRPYLAIFLISSLVATVTSCGNDDNPPPANEEEVITSVKLELVPNAGAPKGVNRVEATYRDLDGDGGNPPTVETLTLAPNVTYSAKLTFLDESKTPAKDITTEIREEADDHQIFYDKLPTKDDKTLGENLVVSDLDKDNKGLPLGLQAKIATVNSLSLIHI